ncbi:MAG: cytochrome P450 [Granulosicoccus sp.]
MYELEDEKFRFRQDPADPQFFADPYPFYKRLHEQGTAIYWQEYGLWCVSRFDSVNQILRDKRFARLPPPANKSIATADHMQDFARAERYSLLALEPPEHTRLRRLVNHAFVRRKVEQLQPVVTAMANAYIDSFERRQSTDLVSSFASVLPVQVITQLLGIPSEDGPQLVDWSHTMVRVYTLTQSEQDERKANHASACFISYIEKLLTIKRKKPDDGLLSHLLQIQREHQSLLDDEIISISILLLNAGHEATVHQIGNAIYTLLETYPSQRRAELRNMLNTEKGTEAVVAECLRFDAPLHLFTRFAQEDVQIEPAVCIRKGDQVGLLLAAANRCPQKFSHPDRFIPLRDDAAHLSLGAGIHFCLGAQLARMELKVALRSVFARLPEIRLQAKPEFRNTYHFRGLQKLPVVW